MSNSTCMVSLLQYMTAFRWGFPTELFLHAFLIHAVYRAHYHISWTKQRGIYTFLCNSLTNIFVVETSEVGHSRRFVVVVASALRARLMCTLSLNTRRQGVRTLFNKVCIMLMFLWKQIHFPRHVFLYIIWKPIRQTTFIII